MPRKCPQSLVITMQTLVLKQKSLKNGDHRSVIQRHVMLEDCHLPKVTSLRLHAFLSRRSYRNATIEGGCSCQRNLEMK